FNFEDITDSEKEFKVSGTLNLHGVNKEITSKLYISKRNETIWLRGDFIAMPQDFNIKIPKIVRNKIAKEVQVQFDFKLKTQ
ncbi:MAG: YceI family protein, partial [Flavobacteriaceae bacterium]|nr:YceI family protein [Flavobacteriaceae bacterium]